MRWHTLVFDLLSVGWVDFALEQNLREVVPQADVSARLTDGLTSNLNFLTCHILPPIRA
jgi:hypothetical protein